MTKKQRSVNLHLTELRDRKRTELERLRKRAESLAVAAKTANEEAGKAERELIQILTALGEVDGTAAHAAQ